MMQESAEDAGFSVSCVKTLEIHGNLRCICNRLICKIDADIIEVKCARCKRIIQIHTNGIDKIECI